MSLFSRRHYDWLANYAIDAKLSTEQLRILSIALYADNQRYSHERFMTLLDKLTIYLHKQPTAYRGTFTRQ